MAYKFLLFDLDHTLLDFDTAEDIALNLLLEEADVSDIQTYKNYYVPMNKAMWEDLSAGKITKSELINTRFQRLFAYFDKEVDGSYLAERYQYHLSQQGQIFEGVMELLQNLKRANYQLFAATNGVTFIQKGRLSQSTIAAYFDQIFISDEIGSHKPEKAFFEKISRQINNFTYEEALMIGDSLSADIQGGINSGIDTVWFNQQKLENHSLIKPTYIVNSYSELWQLLK